MGEESRDFREEWPPEMDQIEAAIREGSFFVACMFRELKNQGLSTEDAAITAVHWNIASNALADRLGT